MRKTPYMIALVGLLISLSITLVSVSLPYWLHAASPTGSPGVRYVDYGLYARCERRWLPIEPGGRRYREYICKSFPTRSVCDEEGQGFCVAWSVAGFTSQFGILIAAAALIALTLANVTSKRKRRTAWKIISTLIGIHAAMQIIAMAVVVHLLRIRSDYFSVGTTYSIAFYLNIASWVIDVLLVTGLVTTAFFARKGYRWAAGRRPYQPIPDRPNAEASSSNVPVQP